MIGREEEDSPLYIVSRTALLDALEALETHLGGVVLVGAQAVYLRTMNANTTVAAYTTDADLALNPAAIGPNPPIESLMLRGGFTSGGQPGQWSREVVLAGERFTVAVDLMVPDSLAGASGRRSVNMEGHDRRVARRTTGLEASTVDHGPMRVPSLDTNDIREFTVLVAGVGALLIAKVHKIRERVVGGREGRELDKDAADIYRLFQGTSVEDMAIGIRRALESEISRPTTEAALEGLVELFSRRGAVGVEMAVRAVGGTQATVRTVCIEYTIALAARLRGA